MYIASKSHGRNKRDCEVLTGRDRVNKKGEGENGRNACYKNQAVRIIMPTDFQVIKLCQLSIQLCLPIRNRHVLLPIADFTREFTMFTAQSELANRNVVAASLCRNEQKGAL